MALSTESKISQSTESFFKACEDLAAQLAKFDILARGVSKEARVKALSVQNLGNIENIVLSELNRLAKNSYQVGNLEQEILITKSFLDENNFSYDDRVFDYLKEGCFLEIYDSSFKALYKTPSIFSFSSYSVADYYLFTWSELYGREEKYNLAVADKVVEAFHSNSTNIIRLEVEPHSCYEKFSKYMHEAITSPICFAPIVNSENVRALITVNKIYDINTKIAD